MLCIPPAGDGSLQVLPAARGSTSAPGLCSQGSAVNTSTAFNILPFDFANITLF